MPTNLMHRVLAIQELLRHILGVFRLNRNDFQDARRRSEATSTFAALARTCKLFHEVSLDYLWETLPNVLPIVLLLSDSVDRSDVGTQSRVITSALAWIIQRSPTTDADIPRLLKYAPRIRNLIEVNQGLHTSTAPEVCVDAEVFESLSKIKSRGSDCLFPNIRLLQWPVHGVHYTCIDYASIFVGPNITEVDFRDTLNSDKMGRTLKQFESYRPPVKHLGHHPGSFDPLVIPLLIHAILKSPSLTSVRLDYHLSDLNEWSTLAQLPSLSSLEIYVPEDHVAGSPLVESAFPSLKELTLRFKTKLRRFKYFLDHFLEHRLPYLIGLTLEYDEPHGSIYTILRNLHRVCDPEVLETMNITHLSIGSTLRVSEPSYGVYHANEADGSQ
ncbi:hypothetical protein NLI96_g11465 [Meripilus lineatus]|uniref:Uncharacterized protein n=1 Tax=Meripilus lineatus TaxID=2056292 RepID=A0AAD5UTA0_9APHY|nr:hypothetical protein NLI96_g11465 [Physisporinus lineatus]